MTRFDLHKPSRPGLVGDKPQSGESGDTTSPLLSLFFFFFVGEPVWAASHGSLARARLLPKDPGHRHGFLVLRPLLQVGMCSLASAYHGAFYPPLSPAKSCKIRTLGAGGAFRKKMPAGKTSALRAAPLRAATLRGAETGVPPPARGGETPMSTRKVPPDGLRTISRKSADS